MEIESIRVGVVMQRVALNNRWQPWQWRLLEIVEMEDGSWSGDPAPRLLLQDDADTRWLFPGFEVALYRDEAEGYFLNVDAPNPCWFVMSRLEEGDAGEIAVPKFVTLSYNEAARLMDGGERVDNLPAPAHIVESLRAFVEQHYRPEPKGKRRKPSFEGGAAVDQIARAERGNNGS